MDGSMALRLWISIAQKKDTALIRSRVPPPLMRTARDRVDLSQCATFLSLMSHCARSCLLLSIDEPARSTRSTISGSGSMLREDPWGSRRWGSGYRRDGISPGDMYTSGRTLLY